MQEYQTETVIAADHPSLPGHFPGNPVVPGVVILDRVVEASADWLAAALAEVKNVKFVSPLLPGEPLRIVLKRKGEDGVAFSCRVSDRLVAQGSLVLVPAGA